MSEFITPSHNARDASQPPPLRRRVRPALADITNIEIDMADVPVFSTAWTAIPGFCSKMADLVNVITFGTDGMPINNYWHNGLDKLRASARCDHPSVTNSLAHHFCANMANKIVTHLSYHIEKDIEAYYICRCIALEHFGVEDANFGGGDDRDLDGFLSSVMYPEWLRRRLNMPKGVTATARVFLALSQGFDVIV